MSGSATLEGETQSLRTGLLEMASLVLAQVERAVAAWDETDPEAALRVIEGDDAVDERLVDLDRRIFEIHLLHAPLAGDLRLLHVGIIAVVALERVGDLAVSIAKLAGEVPREGAMPEVESLIRRMSARAVDTLARAVQAIARGDADLGDQAKADARRVRAMLDDVRVAASAERDGPETREWATAAVLVARHLERVANNAAELGGRVRFLVSGAPFERAHRAQVAVEE
ncbi:MAG: hypothetical protein MUE51_06445 [Thermoleophilia bacterium]|jgi:phosphate transport system protein|nr:hypothetical protein [Thermoleophilia bacterium]